jgi:murein DD-endopeptidase MepM/ murein hydrolase activator NlpD
VQTEKPRLGTLALTVGALCSLAAMTAFGVAPLAVSELPPTETLLEPVTLQAESYEAPASFIQQEAVRRGETLSSLVSRLGIDDQEFGDFVRRDATARKLLQLRAGRTVTALVGPDGTLHRLSYRLSSGDDDGLGNRLVIRRSEGRLVAIEEPVPIERSVEMRSIEVDSSLIAAIDAADIPDNVITRMADIFGENVDFNRGIRRGDRLRVVYETIRESGSIEPPVIGRILAVQFRSGARKLEAVWFDHTDSDGEYYTFDGKSLKRSFLASPLEFTRVSSGFTESRRHPVMRDWRAHKGIDLPAPSGTNVRSTADGVIEFIGSQRGYGNVIVIRHDARHTTLYAHLRRFSDGLRPGSRVRQGDVIGQVGMTGWATGPHLHFEFHVDGNHVDPTVAVAPPPTRRLNPAERARFAALATQYSAHFGLLDTQLAARFQ